MSKARGTEIARTQPPGLKIPGDTLLTKNFARGWLYEASVMGKLNARIQQAVAASAKGLFAAVLVVGGCSSLTSDEAPVDDSTFVEVMIELHLASARAQLHYERPTALRDSILARHGLDEARYEAAIAYYLERPDAYSEINEAVLDRMAAESRRLYK